MIRLSLIVQVANACDARRVTILLSPKDRVTLRFKCREYMILGVFDDKVCGGTVIRQALTGLNEYNHHPSSPFPATFTRACEVNFGITPEGSKSAERIQALHIGSAVAASGEKLRHPQKAGQAKSLPQIGTKSQSGF
jgi:hypothetical protein